MSYAHFHNFWLLAYPHLSIEWSINCVPQINSFIDINNFYTLAFYLFVMVLIITLSNSLRWCLLFGLFAFLPSSNIIFHSEKLVSEANNYSTSIAFCILLARLLTWPMFIAESKQEKDMSTTPETSTAEAASDVDGDDDNADEIQANQSNDGLRRRTTTTSKSGQTLAIAKKVASRRHAKTSSSKKPALKIMSLLILGGLAVCVAIVSLYSVVTYRRNSMWSDDVQLLNDSLNTCPNSAKLHYMIGMLFLGSEEYNTALDHFDQALEVYPTYCEANYKYGYTRLHVDGEFMVASKYFNKSLDCNSTREISFASISQLYDYMIEREPQYSDLHIQYASLIGRYQPESAASHYYDAGSIELKKNEALATQYFEQSLTIFIQQVTVSDQMEQWCTAFDWIQMTYSRIPSGHSYLDTLLSNAQMRCN
ncbi:hypothetical protein SAMD00019534_123330 [Acytostelium subglobosum LB1]|uniref:hypothetical protein n=1 Tax=Acytostelium subglobosum LB1 TaxID=1410327 RepID=UPI000644B2A3|nr:hypothetical protein SAMD00019534_123330 [Acytostelium subglobosum LB1]GAM29157.1 hypothetical protein SAMD00019534_123330 [Acytostelium subglobosum LB1]|eukprot:XP_012747848.1 hypothetical protein SAMD00019534_123330 [Acytostelium subglobosum LB1]